MSSKTVNPKIKSSLYPVISVTAPTGTTITCNGESYTLSGSETMHSFIVPLGTYSVVAVKDGQTKTETVLADIVAVFSIEFSFSRLPAEYQEVEYIESNGSQYILSNAYTNAISEVDMVFMPTAWINTNTDCFFGYASVSPNYLSFERSYSKQTLFYRYYSTTYDTYNQPVLNLNQKYHMYFSGVSGSQRMELDGVVQVQTSLTGTISTAYQLGIFGLTGNSRRSAMRLYSLKTSYQGSVNHEYVPCYRKADGIVGLYDRIANAFFTNDGSGLFTRGAAVNALPQGYTQVNHVGSSGTQYVDTGVTVDRLISYEIHFAFSAVPSTSQYNLIGGTGTLGYANQSFIVYTYSGNTMIGVGVERPTGVVPSTTPHTYLIHNQSDNLSYVDGKSVASSYNSSFVSNGRKLFLLNSDHASRIAAFVLPNGNLYRATIISNGSLIREFVPCIRDSDSVVGLYDIVNDTFYTNAGTGTFSYG